MTKTVSARITNEVHEKLRNQCNNAGCSINDFLVASIELALTGHTEFDFGDEEIVKNDIDKDKEIPKSEVVRIID